MKKNTLQTKRKSKTGFRALYAKTVAGKKQRVAATATAEDLDAEVPSVGIGRALTVILVLHIIAIAAIYIGTQWQDGKGSSGNSAVVADPENKADGVSSRPAAGANPGALTVGEPGSLQLPSDNASRPGNNGVVADNGGVVSDRPEGETPSVTQPERREARIISSNRDKHVPPKALIVEDAPTGYISYKIKDGDTYYSLSRKYKVDQAALIAANPDVPANRMIPGKTIKIPKK